MMHKIKQTGTVQVYLLETWVHQIIPKVLILVVGSAVMEVIPERNLLSPWRVLLDATQNQINSSLLRESYEEKYILYLPHGES